MFVMNAMSEAAQPDGQVRKGLAAIGGARLWNVYRNFNAAIERSTRMVIEPSLTAAIAENSIERPSSLVELLPALRCPYPSLWIEWTGKERGYSQSDTTAVPVRAGLLIESLNDDGSIFKFTPAWIHPQTPELPNIGIYEGKVDTQKALFDVEPYSLDETEMIQRKKRELTEKFGASALEREVAALLDLDSHFADKVSDYYHQEALQDPTFLHLILPDDPRDLAQRRNDTGGETHFLMAILMFLCAPNAIERRAENVDALNKQRRKNGKAPLHNYESVRMRLSPGERHALAGEDGATRRKHVCRGHFKARKQKDGSLKLFWWRAHIRGAGALVNPIRILGPGARP